MLKILRKEKGFTMIEMMVVLIIIAVLVGGGIKFYTGYIGKAKIDKAKADLSTMQAAVDSFYAENGFYPEDSVATSISTFGLSTLQVGVTGGTVKNYMYDQTASNTYRLYTSVQVDGINFIVGEGTNGSSEKAGAKTTTS